MIAGSRRDWFGLPGFDPGPGRHGGFLYVLDEVGSTSDFLLGRGDPAPGRLCRWDGWGWQAGDRHMIPPPVNVRPGSLAVARRQSGGRGRQGRSWFTAGGLAMSWTIAPVPSRQASRLAVWTGLMAAAAVGELTGRPVRLKWPNDLWLDDRKLGGMILDLVQKGPERLLVAGLGVNVGDWPVAMPGEVRAMAASLPEGPETTPAALAAAVLGRCDGELARFLDQGWAPYRPLFDELDLLRDRSVVLAAPSGTVSGTARGIDDTGALLLDTPSGDLEAVLAGDVHLTDIGSGTDGRRGP